MAATGTATSANARRKAASSPAAAATTATRLTQDVETPQPSESRLHLPRILRELGRWLALAALTLNIAALSQTHYWISPEALGVVKRWRVLADGVRTEV